MRTKATSKLKNKFLNKKLNKITLSFKNSLENEFKEDYFSSSLPLLRLSFLLGLFYYSAFAILDYLVMPDIIYKIWFIRFSVVCPAIIIMLILSYSKNFYKWWQTGVFLVTTLAGLGIVIMTIFIPAIGKFSYFVGIILVLIYCYMLIRLRFIWASLAGLIIVISYIIASVFITEIPQNYLYLNLFFLISANILGMFGAYALEYYNRKEFYTRTLLEQEKQKVKDINSKLEKRVSEKTKALQTDIKKIQEIQQNIRKSEKKFRFFTENVPGVVSIYKWFPNGKREIVFQGPGLEEIIGSELATEVSNDIEKFFELIPREDFQKLDEEAMQALKTDNKLESEYRLHIAENNVKWVESHFSLFPQKDGSILWQGIIFDITKQKRTENTQKVLYQISNAVNTIDNLNELFSKIRNYLNQIIDTTNFYIALYNENTDTITLPYSVDEIDEHESFPAGKTLTKYVIQTLKPLFADYGVIQELENKGLVEEIGTPSKIWLGVPLIVENKPIGAIVVQSYEDENLYDKDDIELLAFVSEGIALAIKHIQAHEQLKRTNAELKILKENLQKQVDGAVHELRNKDHLLIKQSRHAAMGEMIGNIAHQWRQPLAAVAAIVQDIEDAYEYNELNEKYLADSVEKTMKQLNYMSRTIDDFRNFFKPNKEKKQFSIPKILEDTINFIEKSFSYHNIKINFQVKKDSKVNGFSNEYSQTVLNILNNSKDAIVGNKISHGKIDIVADINEKGQSVVNIKDNGGGIPAEVIDKIFDPYFSTKKQGKGTGIGLYMAKMIIEENMGGEIIAQNINNGVQISLIL
jgi:PAS domain S-box-containing protein